MKEIYEISAGVEYHLKQLEDFTEVLRDVKHSLDETKRGFENRHAWELKLIKKELEDVKSQLAKYGLPEASAYEKELNLLKELLHSDNWPAAVDENAICDREETKVQRANAILDMVIAQNVEGIKFLDYGCGTGHVVEMALARNAIAKGYDIRLDECAFDRSNYTDSFEELLKSGPFDIILLHDVLDHLERIDPITAMQQVRTLLKPEGQVYVRNHPWCSRHGGHCYTQINKAFVHLVFDEVELTRVGGFQADYNIKVKRPLETYRHWFHESQFKIKSEIPIKEELDNYFLQPSPVLARIAPQWNDQNEMHQDMEIQFVEYVLEPQANFSQLL